MVGIEMSHVTDKTVTSKCSQINLKKSHEVLGKLAIMASNYSKDDCLLKV